MASKISYTGRSHFVFGVVVIVIGVAFLLDNLNILDAGEIFRYWPVLLILLGISRLTSAVSMIGKMVGLFFIAAGTLMVLDRMHFIEFYFWDWWPLILILIGGRLLLNSSRWRSSVGGGTPNDTDSVINLFAFMSGYNRASFSQDFRGGELSAIMGGCDIDLRQASITSGPAVLNVFAFWGGIDVKVPQDWSVVLEGTPIMGSIEDNTHPTEAASEKRLIVRGTAIMGGVEIAN